MIIPIFASFVKPVKNSITAIDGSFYDAIIFFQVAAKDNSRTLSAGH